MLAFTLRAIALGAIASSTLSPAFAEQKALQADLTLRSELKYLLYTPDGYEASQDAYPSSSGCTAATRAATRSPRSRQPACRS